MRPRAAAAAIALAALSAPAAAPADSGRWLVTGSDSVPSSYRQGLASDARARNVFFSGPFAGLYRTRNLRVLAKNTRPIPPDVARREQYNHIGDVAWDAAEGGRLLLPLESYTPFEADPNPAKTGSIGVADATGLAWRYYVKLDPSEIAKAQWLATDPQGLVWTISGSDLLAYDLADVNAANAAPGAAPIRSVRRLAGVAPDGAGGAVVHDGRLYLSTRGGDGINRLVSVNTSTGATRVELRRRGDLEPEGLDAGGYSSGILHWELVPSGGLGNVDLLHLVPKGARLRLRLSRTRLPARRRTRVVATVTVASGGYRVRVEGVRVRLGRRSALTNANGRARLWLRLPSGRYRALAFRRGLRSGTRLVRVSAR